MNRIQFVQVVERYRLETINGEFFFNNLRIFFSNTYYAVVHGKIPYLLAKQIRENDPENTLEIRVEGNHKSVMPENCATNKELNNYAEQLTEERKSPDEWEKLYRQKRKELITKCPEQLYIECYHIDSTDGLEVFLKQANAYFEKN